jgi:hypothetical protein
MLESREQLLRLAHVLPPSSGAPDDVPPAIAVQR